MTTPPVVPADRPTHRPSASKRDTDYAKLTPAERHAAKRCAPLNPNH
jgi:hypothetical protein